MGHIPSSIERISSGKYFPRIFLVYYNNIENIDRKQ